MKYSLIIKLLNFKKAIFHQSLIASLLLANLIKFFIVPLFPFEATDLDVNMG